MNIINQVCKEIQQRHEQVCQSLIQTPLGQLFSHEPKEPAEFDGFGALSSIEALRLHGLTEIHVSPNIFDFADTLTRQHVKDFVVLESVTADGCSDTLKNFLAISGDFIRGVYKGEDMPLRDAFAVMRQEVSVRLGPEKVVKGIPLFGALNPENIDAIFRSMVAGIQSSYLANIPRQSPVHLIDIGANGWGSTSAMLLQTVKAAVTHKTQFLREAPPLHIHLVDKQFDRNFLPLGLLPFSDSFQFHDYHPLEEKLEISQASKNYLPQVTEPGSMLLRELRNPELIQLFEENNVTIHIHRSSSNEFFEKYGDILAEEVVGYVGIDGEHTIVDGKSVAFDEMNAALRIGAHVIGTDDCKASVPCSNVAVSVLSIAGRINKAAGRLTSHVPEVFKGAIDILFKKHKDKPELEVVKKMLVFDNSLDTVPHYDVVTVQGTQVATLVRSNLHSLETALREKAATGALFDKELIRQLSYWTNRPLASNFPAEHPLAFLNAFIREVETSDGRIERMLLKKELLPPIVTLRRKILADRSLVLRT